MLRSLFPSFSWHCLSCFRFTIAAFLLLSLFTGPYYYFSSSSSSSSSLTIVETFFDSSPLATSTTIQNSPEANRLEVIQISPTSIDEREYKIPRDQLKPRGCQFVSNPLVELLVPPPPPPPSLSQNISLVGEQEEVWMRAITFISNFRTIPKGYAMGLETFFKNNPNMTLYIYGDLEPAMIDPRFAANGFKIVVMRWDLRAITDRLTQELPPLKDVFASRGWKKLTSTSLRKAMIMSDFARLALMYLRGGTWIDADSIVLRPLIFKNTLACSRDMWFAEMPKIHCTVMEIMQPSYAQRFYGINANPKDQNFEAKDGYYCINGILGGFEKGHPLFREALLDIVNIVNRVHPIMVNTAFGTHVITEVLNSAVLKPEEWPIIYPLERYIGALKPEVLEEKFKGDVDKMLDFLDKRKVFTMHLFHWVYKNQSSMAEVFETGGLFYSLWRANCVFSCDELITKETVYSLR